MATDIMRPFSAIPYVGTSNELNHGYVDTNTKVEYTFIL